MGGISQEIGLITEIYWQIGTVEESELWTGHRDGPEINSINGGSRMSDISGQDACLHWIIVRYFE
jgi:hypothetical protein